MAGCTPAVEEEQKLDQHVKAVALVYFVTGRQLLYTLALFRTTKYADMHRTIHSWLSLVRTRLCFVLFPLSTELSTS